MATPSPESPVPIVNVGDKGTILVNVAGKNLCEEEIRTNNDIYTKPIALKTGTTYTLSSNKGNTNLYFNDSQTNKNLLKAYGVNSLSYTPNKDVIAVGMTYREPKIMDGEMLQLELGSAATGYEPYKTPQNLTVQTPDGLPGIPVSSGGNYTDEKGQQWVCDEIDLARGERVQRIEGYRFTGAENWLSWGVNNITEGITGFYWYYGSVILTKHIEILNTHAVFNRNVYGGRVEGTMANLESIGDDYLIWSVRNEYLEDISSKESAIQSLKKLLGEINAKMLYCLATPIRTPLPPETIAAFRKLCMNYPVTTITNSDNCGMEVAYIADTKAYIDGKIAEISAAIVSK